MYTQCVSNSYGSPSKSKFLITPELRPPTNVLTVCLSREFDLLFPKTVLQAHAKIAVYILQFFFSTVENTSYVIYYSF